MATFEFIEVNRFWKGGTEQAKAHPEGWDAMLKLSGISLNGQSDAINIAMAFERLMEPQDQAAFGVHDIIEEMGGSGETYTLYLENYVLVAKIDR